ncbi:nematode fatty acid retinoid binding protein [Ancylostoma ceylanicum]|uniref:Fatty-acid and retinol-binding protein 1 n=1 Tax=Ancylostoma ceylanicum TaxID=53326 RepID=A0A0D6M971_9BILA|nr:nematode fatty acid retinoid binding protein [Ancylostoma ceylanicum]
MLRLIVPAAVLFAYGSAFRLSDIPEDYRDLVPKEVKFFLAGLSDSDMAVLREIHRNIGAYRSEEEILAAIRMMSPSLYEKAERFYSMITRKVNSLGPEAQAFAIEVGNSRNARDGGGMPKNLRHLICLQMMNTARNFRVQYLSGRRPSRADLKQAALYVVYKYRAMSDNGKLDFQREFPILSKIFRSEKIRRRLESLN